MRNRPRYVVMAEDLYQEWLDDRHEAFVARVRLSLEDVRAGRVHSFNIYSLTGQLLHTHPAFLNEVLSDYPASLT